ncbi:CD1375 family protein [Jutongia sp.]
MAKVYASLIIKGIKNIDDVPKRILEEVKQELIKEGHPELAQVGDED